MIYVVNPQDLKIDETPKHPVWTRPNPVHRLDIALTEARKLVRKHPEVLVQEFAYPFRTVAIVTPNGTEMLDG